MAPRTLVMLAALALPTLWSRAARAQTHADAGAPAAGDPWALVHAAIGDAPFVVHHIAQHTGGAHDWTFPVLTRQNDCYRLVGAALGASRVTGAVTVHAAHVAGTDAVFSSNGRAVETRWCASLPGRIYWVAVHADGPSRWALAVVHEAADAHPLNDQTRHASSPDAGVAAPVVVARPAVNYPLGGVEADYVGNQLRAFARDHGETRAVVAAVRANLPTNQAQELTLPLEAGRCVDVVAAGVPSVHDLVLELADPAGNRVAQDTEHAALESVHFCATYGGGYRLTVRMFAGFGQTGIQAFEAAR